MIRRLLKRLLYGGSSSLRTYEASCLGCLRNALRPEAQEILEAQLQSIDLIQRASDDKLVMFYLVHDKIRLFPNRAAELYAARMIIAREKEKSLVCEFVFHEGRISSMEFGRSPLGVHPSAITCATIELLEDLMASGEANTSSSVGGRLLAAIRQIATIGDVIAPASRERRQLLMKRLSTFGLPEDYSEVLAEADGFVCDGWRFLGTRGRKIVLSDRTYFVAAETNDGQSALCFRDDSQIPQTVFYDEIDDFERPAGERFVDAFIKVLRERSLQQD